MNLKLNLPQEKIEMFALFWGAVFIATTLSQSTFYLTQHKLPPPGAPLPFWISAWFWLMAVYLVTQVHNALLRVAIISWGISMFVSWLMSDYERVASLVIYHGFHLLAGVLMVIVGIRKNRFCGYMLALFLLVGLSTINYYATYNWEKVLETIPRSTDLK